MSFVPEALCQSVQKQGGVGSSGSYRRRVEAIIGLDSFWSASITFAAGSSGNDRQFSDLAAPALRDGTATGRLSAWLHRTSLAVACRAAARATVQRSGISPRGSGCGLITRMRRLFRLRRLISNIISQARWRVTSGRRKPNCGLALMVSGSGKPRYSKQVEEKHHNLPHAPNVGFFSALARQCSGCASPATAPPRRLRRPAPTPQAPSGIFSLSIVSAGVGCDWPFAVADQVGLAHGRRMEPESTESTGAAGRTQDPWLRGCGRDHKFDQGYPSKTLAEPTG